MVKYHKPETKLKIAASLTGQKKPAITRARMREARLRYLAKQKEETPGQTPG